MVPRICWDGGGHGNRRFEFRRLSYNHRRFRKNHLGDHAESLPTAHGFQEYWGWLYHFDAMQGVSFVDLNKSPLVQGIPPPCMNLPVPGLPKVPVPWIREPRPA